MQDRGSLHFTVDSLLLQELGERLIGKPYIALAELVKNAYDADARLATVIMDVGKKIIRVDDTGHGMTFEEFEGFWMRVGSRHKEKRLSKLYNRQMTGSKGVGRLAVQFLAGELTISTVSNETPNYKLNAHVIWAKAVKSGELTDATVDYWIDRSSDHFTQGTSIILNGLKQQWDVKEVEGLAKELWWLRPPFRSGGVNADPKTSFDIDFQSQVTEFKEAFERQMKSILDNWYVRIVGKNEEGTVTVSMQYKDDKVPKTYQYSVENCQLHNCDFEIRIFNLVNRQPGGLSVDKAREYFNEFGGAHVYDNGFHLPYYGNPKNDWLGLEFDVSHRLSTSQLLPAELQVPEGLQNLPTLSRIYGVVNVNTSKELGLQVLITRDRLQDSLAFQQLASMVRWPIDLYAMEETKKKIQEFESDKDIQLPKFEKFDDVLTRFKDEIPEESFVQLRRELKEAEEQIETEAEATAKQVGLMGSLATVGISTVAFQHELRQQFITVDSILADLQKVKVRDAESPTRSWMA